MNSSLKQKVIKGFAWTSLASAMAVLINIGQMALMSRFMTKEEIGILSILTVALGFAAKLNVFSTSSSIIHFQDSTKVELNTLFWLNVFTSIGIYIIVFISAPLIADYYQMPVLISLIRLFGLSIIISSLGQHFISLFQKSIELKTVASIDILSKSIILICFVYFILQRPEHILLGMIISLLAGAAFHSASYMFFGTKNYYTPNIRQISISSSKKYLVFNLYQMSSGAISYLSGHLDKLFLANFFGLASLGIYDMGLKLIQKPIALVNPIFNAVSFPLLSKLQKDKTKLNAIYLYKIESIAFLLIPAFFGIYLLADEIVLLLYGEGWEMTATIVKVLCGLGIARCIANPMGPYLLSLGRPDIGLYLNIYRLVVVSCLFIIGGKYLDFQNSIILFVIGSILFTIPPNYIVRSILTSMSSLKHIGTYIRPLIISVIMFVLLLSIEDLTKGMQWNTNWRMAFIVLVGILSYLFLSLIFNRKLLIKIQTTLKSP